MKPFLTVDGQMLKIYSRGMHINSLDDNRYFLLRKNYYNTMNVYGRLFYEDDNQNKYKNNSKFSEIKALYFFDKELRDLSFKKIIEVEANLKSTTAYIFSKYYPNKKNYKKTTSFNLFNRKGNICRQKIDNFSFLQGITLSNNMKIPTELFLDAIGKDLDYYKDKAIREVELIEIKKRIVI